MKIVFMGTPEFAAKNLAALVGEFEVAAVFTQPDKPKNRGKKLETTPVKDFALERNIPVYQPRSLRKGEDAEAAMEALREINPDVIVVTAYGQILPKSVLELPKYGCVNVHASLLPRFRGAAPIQRCIEAGDEKTGICTMQMDEGLDTGDVLMRAEVEITSEMTGSELTEVLAERGAKLICETLHALENGTARREKQQGEACYAEKILKGELKIDFTKPARNVHNFIRAMADVPCAYTFLDGKRLKVYRAAVSAQKSALPAGTIADEKKFIVSCGDGECVELLEIQLEGSKRMKTEDFLRGKKISSETVLGI